MLTASVQFQPRRAPIAEPQIVRALQRAIPDAQIETGEDNGRYINFHFSAHSPKDALAKLHPLLNDRTLGQAARSSCIVICQGNRGWEDYLLLHHYDRRLPLDSPSVER